MKKKKKKLSDAKRRIDELKLIIIKKQQQLNKFQDDLYNIKISWKICEEQLFDLQKAWEKRVGAKFEHKEITREAIINRYKISKMEEVDQNEAKLLEDSISDVSDNEDPTAAEEIEALKKSRKELLMVENLKIVKSVKKIEIPEEVPANFQELYKKNIVDNDSESDKNEDSIEQERHAHKKKIKMLTQRINIEETEQSADELEEDSSSSDEEEINKNTKTIKRAQKTRKFTNSKRNTGLSTKKKSLNQDLTPNSPVPKTNLDLKLTKNEGIQLSDYSISDINKWDQTPSNKINNNDITPESTKSKSSNNQKFKQLKTFFSNTHQIKISENNLNTSLIEQFDPSNKSYNNEIEELLKLEKEFNSSQQNFENQLIKSLNPEQLNLYKKYKQILEDLENIRKQIGIIVNSKGIQCIFDNNQSLSGVKNKLFDKNRSVDVDLLSKTSDNKFFNSKIDPLETFQNNTDAKTLLNSVFDGESQLKLLSIKNKQEIANILKSHIQEKCKEICPHFLRVMKIKWKTRGIPYPLKNVLMRSMEFKSSS